jgi:multidrug efflux system outer membrane protein
VRRRAAAGACALALALGCAVGPNYRRPELPVAPSFRDRPEEAASIADLFWWEVFRDEALGSLIRESLEHNRDLQTAAARVEEARYVAAVVRGELLPQVGYEADAARGKQSFLDAISPGTGKRSSFLAALAAAWEIDLWGRIRRASEAARAQMLGTEAVRRGVVLSLVSGVAEGYFSLLELDLELEISRRTERSFQETVDLFTRRFEGGVTSRLDPLRAEAARAQVAAAIPDLERRIVAQENALSVLVGRVPGGIPRGAALTAQSSPPRVPAGVPSLLLERRPDLLEAEQALVGANAQVGVALAEFFPRIGLTSFYGGTSAELSDLLESSALTWAVAARAAGPLFTWGQTWYGYQASKEFSRQALLQYQQSVLLALREVSDALTAREKVALVVAELEHQVEVLGEALRMARTRYVGGYSNYIEVLDAQQQLFPAELALARARLDELLALVALYRALGGGWSSYAGEPAVPSPLAP